MRRVATGQCRRRPTLGTARPLRSWMMFLSSCMRRTCSEQTVVNFCGSAAGLRAGSQGEWLTSRLLGAAGRIPPAAMLLVWRGSMDDLSACVQALGFASVRLMLHASLETTIRRQQLTLFKVTG